MLDVRDYYLGLYYHAHFEGKTEPRTWVNVFTIMDVTLHMADADHVLNLLVPDREVD